MGGKNEEGHWLNDVFIMQTANDTIEKIAQGGLQFLSANNDSVRVSNNKVIALVENRGVFFVIEYNITLETISTLKPFWLQAYLWLPKNKQSII